MQVPQHLSAQTDVNRLSSAAAALGYEIVDIAGFLDLVEAHAHAQTSGLKIVTARARDMSAANADVREAVQAMAEQTETTVTDVVASAEMVRQTGEKSRAVAGWVQQVSSRTQDVADTLDAVKRNNQQIASIATQVNTLAINAKIEAARAGESGRGFAVVAEAINELSRQTRGAAVQITENVETLTDWIFTLGQEANGIAEQASDVLEATGDTDAALGRVEASVSAADTQAKRISEQAHRVDRAISEFTPALAEIESAVKDTTSGVEETHVRILNLIDTSETIVQSTALLGNETADARFIHEVTRLAGEVASQMETALSRGEISMSRLFDRSYRPIPDTNPEQFMTESTRLMDQIMPAIQEPALGFDPKIVFCAAVDVNGYLPSHNKKFSQPQTNDPVWNTANCRNRRIFDDRVGLKAGRNTEPFLLQVYRRDMGGGAFKMMKDLSAPIFVQGRHWGGLRLAYSFE
ncbi:chemotaxis protein [Roseobacter denitrificans]|uniref:Methyl-accepting chemotaxis protein, putative n=1 Tax=Roseobacter denitrificans (strain ATCC 33942 / OCh 114) TaxID=375451 RepID=Q166D8_ROSDO|nr:methyl-accepting chemotaxis protein, putative [Roseobacter denitrificans OCh 114]AVL51661.1 chemotaxis protein [Roseobacter denitrificans]SFF78071.1 methyl-accepting chemotaxis protein [Roseobacter denitrificans OCh 114]